MLIDAGFPGQHDEIMKQINKFTDFSKVRKVVLTHQDIDHIGSVNALKKHQELEILAFTDEIKFIEGKVMPHKLAKFDNYGEDIPADQQSKFEMLKGGFAKSYTDVQTPLYNGQKIDFGLTVIHTPGHTDGHICLYHEPSKTLIGADLFFIEDGYLRLPVNELNVCSSEVLNSLDQLKKFPIEKVITYHTGLFEGDVQGEIKRLQGE